MQSRRSISAGDDSTNVIADGDVTLIIERNAPTELIDKFIDVEVEKLRKSRFFSEFDSASSSMNLGMRVNKSGALSGGSDTARGRALAWCARILSPLNDYLDEAVEYLELARVLTDSPEVQIAEAFIVSQREDKAAALQILARIDSDVSRSAGLMIVAHHDGPECALQWMTDTGRTASHLDSDGKSFLLSHQLQQGCWSDAAQTVRALCGADFTRTPVLYHLAGLATLINVVPVELRTTFLTQGSFALEGSLLASGADAMDARRVAHTHFIDAVRVAMELGCPLAAREADEYALGLELCDPVQNAHGKARLETMLEDPDLQLGVVHFAVQFGVKLNLDLVEQNIDQQVAMNGGMTNDAALARFAISFTKPTPEEAANYIARYQDQLAEHISMRAMLSRQIQLYSRAGRIEKAGDALGQLIDQGVDAEEERRLRGIIEQSGERDAVESRRAQYRATEAFVDLVSLVHELEDHQQWDDLCVYGMRLFQLTKSLQDAERLAGAFSATHRSEELVGFLSENADLLPQSSRLRMSYAWALYDEGELPASRAALAELSDEADSPNFRALQVSIGIASGDWASLSGYIANEYQNRDDRSAQDLMSTAQLALHVGSPHAKGLVFEAAERAEDDPAVLVAAYSAAVTAGWEDDPKVAQWLEIGAKLSDQDGPLQKMSLKDLTDRKPEWDRRESETWDLLKQGRVPMFLAARSLNRTLIGVTTFPTLANLIQPDPRRTNVIPAYSGRRVPLNSELIGKSVALDATALLTLGLLGLLDIALDALETAYVPHSTLAWLFEERQKAVFHQPSRIAGARKVRDFLASGELEGFAPSTVADSDLSAQVGDELAALIAEAGKARDGDTQHVVIRPAPVYRLSSFMEEQADLSSHASVLSSCLSVVEKLRRKSQVTASEAGRAYAYLQLREEPWPHQPDIADGAVLYLDDLAITYLLHLGMLGKLKNAGLRAVASPRGVAEADALISYDRISQEVLDVMERIRASVNAGIESGHIRVGKKRNLGAIEGEAIPGHPTLDIFALAPYCDSVIVDDRFLNQHMAIHIGESQASVRTTLDLLDALVVADAISNEERLEHRTRLRRAGYALIPVEADELGWWLRESSVSDGTLVEAAELKAIRESILRIRMSDWLQLPEEAPWLDGTFKAYIEVLRSLWVDGADIDAARARSDWLVEQLDIRGWAHALVSQIADSVVRGGRAAHVRLLLMPPMGVEESIVDAYWSWVEERVLASIKEQFPEVYEGLVDLFRRQVAEMLEARLPEEDL